MDWYYVLTIVISSLISIVIILNLILLCFKDKIQYQASKTKKDPKIEFKEYDNSYGVEV